MQQNGHGGVNVNSVIWPKLALQLQRLSQEDQQHQFIGAEHFQTFEYIVYVEMLESEM